MTADDLEDRLRSTLHEEAAQIDAPAVLPPDLRPRVSALHRRRLAAMSTVIALALIAVSGAALAANHAHSRELLRTTDHRVAARTTESSSTASTVVIPPPPPVPRSTRPSTTTWPSTVPTTTVETTTVPSSPPQCTQIATRFEAIGALTGGQWAGSFWVRNTGGAPCVVHGALDVYLADASGEVLAHLHRAANPATIELAPYPAEPSNPPQGDIASFAILWHEIDVASGGGP
ncbi:MAG: hypothetical protein JO291_06160, partial [Acidimicrobiia bacterium]|nr:hypothetical protein [Acidimicrobiia bacterium]